MNRGLEWPGIERIYHQSDLIIQLIIIVIGVSLVIWLLIRDRKWKKRKKKNLI